MNTQISRSLLTRLLDRLKNPEIDPRIRTVAFVAPHSTDTAHGVLQAIHADLQHASVRLSARLDAAEAIQRTHN